MNSQDKPIEANDNLDESLSTSDATELKEEILVDLWTGDHEYDEMSTEFISAETANNNDAEALEKLNLDSQKDESESESIDLDLDNWDFRNLEAGGDSDLEADQDLTTDITDALAVDNNLEIESSQPDSLGEESLADLSLDELREPEALESIDL